MSEIFKTYQSYLFAVAYRMLGSVMDAEDMVQETYLRWRQVDTAVVENPKAFLTTIMSRLCIDQLRSAREQREQYVGPWLPEPLLTDPRATPAEQAALADSLTTAYLLLLERLSPTERAAFLLRKVFAFEYAEIGAILEKREAACRQLVSRASRRLGRLPTAVTAVSAPDESLARRFFQAVTTGDVAGLLALLADDVVVMSDGGGQVTAARRPVKGAEHVARFFLGLSRLIPADFQVRFVQVNGQDGAVGYVGKRPFQVFVLTTNGAGQIKSVHMVLNPDKLSRVPPHDELKEAG